MSIYIEFDSTHGILRARINDKFDLDEYRHAMEEITSGEHYPATVSTIWDLRKLDFSHFDNDLAYFVNEIRVQYISRGDAKIVYVVSNQLGYGLMRMFQVLTNTEKSSLVCYEYDEADRWARWESLKMLWELFVIISDRQRLLSLSYSLVFSIFNNRFNA